MRMSYRVLIPSQEYTEVFWLTGHLSKLTMKVRSYLIAVSGYHWLGEGGYEVIKFTPFSKKED
jgi:hypothetical protein